MIPIKVKDPQFTYRAQLVNIPIYLSIEVLKKYVLLTMSKNIFTY